MGITVCLADEYLSQPLAHLIFLLFCILTFSVAQIPKLLGSLTINAFDRHDTSKYRNFMAFTNLKLRRPIQKMRAFTKLWLLTRKAKYPVVLNSDSTVSLPHLTQTNVSLLANIESHQHAQPFQPNKMPLKRGKNLKVRSMS